MSKQHESQKEAKKKAAHTKKEKRAMKKVKREQKGTAKAIHNALD